VDQAALERWRRVAAEFALAAHEVLGRAETAPSRIITLDASYARLEKLSLQQDELLRQALRCVEHQLYRAAHVMAWSAFMDFLEEKLAADGLAAVRAARPKWPAAATELLREGVNEYQLIEVAHAVGLCTKNQTKALLGLLNKRNECAHPSVYFPNLNEALGYITEIMQRIEHLQPKNI
jgi:hypothetical protein